MNQSYKKNFLQAGAIAREVRAFGKSLIVPGASYNAIIRAIHGKIRELGATAAFPPQIALDNVAAHYLPQPDEDITLNAQVVKLDIGVCCQGAIGDCAVTVDLSGKYGRLVEAAEAALAAAEASITVGQRVRDIGKIIAETIHSYGFKPIHNLAGHGLGEYQIHTAPSIPNCDEARAKAIIKAGMTFAIEPFATTGAGWIDEKGEAAIFSQISKGSVPADYRELMARVASFEQLPFAIHDVQGSLSLGALRKGLAELCKRQIIAGYAPLLEIAQGIVAQAENSVLVDENGKVFVTTR